MLARLNAAFLNMLLSGFLLTWVSLPVCLCFVFVFVVWECLKVLRFLKQAKINLDLTAATLGLKLSASV